MSVPDLSAEEQAHVDELVSDIAYYGMSAAKIDPETGKLKRISPEELHKNIAEWRPSLPPTQSDR